MKDQQEAERKKVTSQEIQQALEEQTKIIAVKKESVMNDLAKVEPAVRDAQQGAFSICKQTTNSKYTIMSQKRARAFIDLNKG